MLAVDESVPKWEKPTADEHGAKPEYNKWVGWERGDRLAIGKNAVVVDDSTASLNTNVQAEYNAMSGKQADWFHRGLIPHPFLHPGLPWPGVNPPLPSGFPKIQWPFVHPPLPSGGFPKIQWPFVHPPLPSGGFPKIQWPFVHPPLPSGGFPKIQWPFVLPPLPSGGFQFPPQLPGHPWFHQHPWIPPYMWHPHGATESGNMDNEGAGAIAEESRGKINP
ncbi:WW domain-binding protein 11-like [Forsythia ovata]|uniref:WW domain-binding protein 11-like n=1 Tax=Forsythia ovata TaxID=205694 RepID=A0ABD1SP48_9LAMI